MFERFTERSRRVVIVAQEESRLLNHNYIGTEHILLGLIAEHEGVASRVLDSLGVTLDAARAQVREIIGEGQHGQRGHIPFTPRAKKILELSLREALDMGSDTIGTEHLLLGLVAEGDGVGAQILERLGAPAAVVREAAIGMVSAEPGPAEVAAGVRSWPRATSRVRAEALNEVRDLLASIDRRLSGIERHLGIVPGPGEPPAASG